MCNSRQEEDEKVLEPSRDFEREKDKVRKYLSVYVKYYPVSQIN